MEGPIAAPGNNDAWYSYAGSDDDVILSTRVRLARNLANFPFPQKLRGTDGQRVQAIVFDAFNHLDNGDQFQAISIEKLDPLGSRILQERGVLSAEEISTEKKDGDADTDRGCGIVMRTDGKVSCTVNIEIGRASCRERV